MFNPFQGYILDLCAAGLALLVLRFWALKLTKTRTCRGWDASAPMPTENEGFSTSFGSMSCFFIIGVKISCNRDMHRTSNNNIETLWDLCQPLVCTCVYVSIL